MSDREPTYNEAWEAGYKAALDDQAKNPIPDYKIWKVWRELDDKPGKVMKFARAVIALARSKS